MHLWNANWVAGRRNNLLCTLGIDFGTESVRVLLVDVATGKILDQQSQKYRHGVLDRELPGGAKLPPDYAFQHPQDWLSDSFTACRGVMKRNAKLRDSVIGIGVDFTSCTMLPCKSDGTPLCLVSGYEQTMMAWPKLWKHHGAKAATDRINEVARRRKEKWLDHYGGTVGIEWFFPKALETLQKDPKTYAAADLFIEGGDWYVWQLTRGLYPSTDPRQIVRSTCQAGYKACWSEDAGYPSAAFLGAVDPRFKTFVQNKMPGEHRAPGVSAGELCKAAAAKMDLPAGLPVSTVIIDAHAGLPGAGVAGAGEMVMVIGTSSCHMMNHTAMQLVPGVAGVVKDGIVPGFYGYEGGQASVGDALAWVAAMTKTSHEQLNRGGLLLPAGSGGVLALDFLNGCRSPLMDGKMSGGFLGVTLTTRPEQLYRAMMEATAFGARWFVDTLAQGGVPIRRFVASGGLPPKSPLLMQIYADVLNKPIYMAESDQSVALGAAILGALAAGPAKSGHRNVSSAIKAMARQRKDLVYKPDRARAKEYAKLYGIYLSLANGRCAPRAIMHQLRDMAQA